MTRLYCAAMTDYPRYAIYYVPAPDSDLDRFGAQLLGYDAFSGEDLPLPDGILPAAPDWHDLTSDPRKYGFHATLKAPMSLAPRQDRGRAPRCVCGVRRNAPGDSGDPTGGRLDRGLYRGDPGGAAAGTDPARGRLRQ